MKSSKIFWANAKVSLSEPRAHSADQNDFKNQIEHIKKRSKNRFFIYNNLSDRRFPYPSLVWSTQPTAGLEEGDAKTK